ncbi:MAG: hypothetical protein AAFX58_07725, partial [Pseudomonadota bacterium]
MSRSKAEARRAPVLPFDEAESDLAGFRRTVAKVSTLLIVLWWFTRTRIPLRERVVGFALFVAAL